MTTLAQFRTVCAGTLGLDNTPTGDQPVIDLWANNGITEVLLRTRCKQQSASMNLTAGTKDYTLDRAILLITDCYVNSTNVQYWLERVSADEILAMRRTTTANVSPAQFYAVLGSDLFMIYPTPSSSLDSVTIYYVPRPALMAVSSDAPDGIPQEFQEAVEYYMLAKGADYSDDATSQEGAAYKQAFEQRIRQIKKQVALKGHHQLPRARIRRGRATIPFHDPSRYPI